MRNARYRFLLFGLLFASGLTSLVYQVLWLKELRLLFGNTAQAAAVTLAVFFAGLSLGGWFWGGRAVRFKRPLRTYAVLEVAVALSALLYFLLLDLYYWAYSPLFQLFSGSSPLWNGVRVLLAAGVLLPPAFFMGGTVPAMGQALIREAPRLGTGGSAIYAVNTLGAALGAFLAGFYLPATLGFSTSFLAAVSVNLLIALAAWKTGGEPVSSEAQLAQVAPKRQALVSFPGPTVWVLAFLSGTLTLALEVLWTRMFSQVLHNSVYSFTAILVTFLVALGLGSALARWLCRLRLQASNVLAGLLCLSGLAVAYSSFAFVRVTGGMRYAGSRSDWGEYVLGIFADAALVMLLPAVLMGAVFPYLFKVSENSGQAPGRVLGRLAAVNTAGAIVGSLAAGFLLLGAFGLWTSIQWIALAYLLAALLVAESSLRSGRVLRGAALAGILLAGLGLDASKLPTVRVRAERGEELLRYWEGSHATVAVIERGKGRKIKVDNYYTLGGSSSVEFEQGQAHVPLTLHPNPQSVFFLGMGTGITAGASLLHPVREVVVSELIPEVVQASREYFGPFLNGLFEDERVRVVAVDGRNHLQGDERTYDVIISDLFVPWGAGTGSLYSLQHYRLVHRRLAPEGLFAQWLPLYQVTGREFSIIARTMLEVFPQVTLWRGDFFAEKPIVALIGHKREEPLDPVILTANAARLAGAGPDQQRPKVLPFLLYAGNLSRNRKLFEGAPLNTDDRPVIEYLAPKSQRRERAGQAHWLTSFELADLYTQLMTRLPPEDDPYLSRLAPDQVGYVRAGLSYYKALVYRKANKHLQAQVFFRDFLARVPLTGLPEVDEDDVYSQSPE